MSDAAGQTDQSPPADDGPRPYLTASGELRVPLGCPERYRYWIKGNLSLKDILAELEAPEDVARPYTRPA